MKWRIVVQMPVLLTTWALVKWLDNIRRHGNRYDLRRERPMYDNRAERKIAVRHPMFMHTGYGLLGVQGGLLIASVLIRSKQRRGLFGLLSLLCLVLVELIVNLLTPELNREDKRYRVMNKQQRIRVVLPPNVIDLTEVRSRHVA